MQNFRNILVGVDLCRGGRIAAAELNEPTREAIRRTLWLAGHASARVTFFSSLDVAAEAVGERTLFDESRAVLDALVAEARQRGIDAHGAVAVGRPWIEIIRQVLREQHDLVVVGTRDRGAASRLLFGSTALKLLRKCPCPVWVTKPAPDRDELNILVASDLGEVAEEALHLAVLGGRLVPSRLVLLHAVEEAFDRRMRHVGVPEHELETYRENLRDDAEQALRRQLAHTDYRTLAYGVQVEVADGPADLVILEAIERHNVGLLVMGTLGRAGIAGMLIGNTAERLLSQVPCSVLAIKPKDFVSPVGLPRVLEPEVMDTAEEARDYDAMDHAQVNRVFVEDFLRAAGDLAVTQSRASSSPAAGPARPFPGGGRPLRVLDAGTANARIPIELCRQSANWHVTAVDLADEMLKVAARNTAAAGLEPRITLERADCKRLPYPDACFDAVMSNSILHHLPEPRRGLAEMLRVLKPGGLLFVRDLMRPPDVETLEALVTAYAGDENEHQQQMFRASLHAALTPDDVRHLLQDFHLPAAWVARTSDRHWTISGTVGQV